MMNNKDKIHNQTIEDYYEIGLKSPTENDDIFKAKIEKSLLKMDVLDEFDLPIEVNILEVISKGEEIKDRRKIKFELAGFIAVCLLIISSLFLLSVYTNPSVYLYIYGAASLLLPLIVIPIAQNAKGETL